MYLFSDVGKELGTGHFGRVVKAEAVGIKDAEEFVKTVAVKMVRSQTNFGALQALASELKIMIHLGSHLNVLNLLGACTINITKGMFLFSVLYILRFPNQRIQFLIFDHRRTFSYR